MSQSIAKIKDVCEFVRGLTYSKKDEVDFSNNAVLRATNIDLGSNRLNLTEIRYIDDSVTIKADKKVKVNDILICTASGSKSHLGKVAFIEEELDMAFGGFMGVLRAKPNINPKYLFAFFKSEIFLQHVFNTGDGANINNLKFSQFEDLEIVLPSLTIQQKIVVKLETIFKEIDKAILVSEASAKNAEALFQSYLIEVFEHGKEGWLKKTIGSICKELFAGGDVQKDRMSKFLTSKYTIPIFTNGEKNKVLYGFTDIARVTEPSVTISARGTIGHSEVRYEDFYPAIRLIVATPDLDIVELDFFKYAVKNIKFTHSGSSIPQLTVPMLKNYFIIFPKSKKIQIEIIEKLNGLGKQVLTIKNSASNKQKELNLLKQSILQQAFSGELVKAA